jgi:DNA-binding MarR family transcriptional regulator
MEKAGMVARQDDDADQRLTRVFITERGREREAELDKILMEFLNKTVGALNEQELLDLERLLSKLIFNIEAAVPSEQDRDCG